MGEGVNSPEERHVRSYADLHVRSYADSLPPRSACRLPWSPEGRSASLRERPSAAPSPDRRQPDRGGLWEAAKSVVTDVDFRHGVVLESP